MALSANLAPQHEDGHQGHQELRDISQADQTHERRNSILAVSLAETYSSFKAITGSMRVARRAGT
jgi:hypothetical protein